VKKIMTVAAVAAAILAAGCSEQSNAPEQVQEDSQKPKTVVVNEGMSKEEEEELNERLADLEDEVNDQSAEEPSAQEETRSAEDAARAAAQDYYAAAAAGDYGYTYEELSSYARSQFTEDEWVSANTDLGSDAASYSVDSVNMVDDSIAEVNLTINLLDGSSSERFTRFVLENGSWKHDLTQEEYDLFAGASDFTASPSASATSEPTMFEPGETDYEEEDLPGNEQYEPFVPVPEPDNDPDEDRNGSGLKNRPSTDPPSEPSSSGPSSSPTGDGDGVSYPPASEDDCPDYAPIKGNQQSGIYHEPDGAYYDETDPEECFATAADAEAAGYRASKV
jgi:hypothetical protein